MVFHILKFFGYRYGLVYRLFVYLLIYISACEFSLSAEHYKVYIVIIIFPSEHAYNEINQLVLV